MARLRSNYVEIAFDSIRKKIENYELIPGDIISDLELSKELNMSRTPIREAILELIYVGLVERNKSRVIVKSVTLKDVIEILQTREAIEIMSMKIILHNNLLVDEKKKELIKIHQSFKSSIEKIELQANFSYDSEFHKKIVELSGNVRLLEVFDMVSIQSERLRWITTLTPQRYTESYKEHELIINSLFNNDLCAVIKATEAHIANTIKNYQAILSEERWDKIIYSLKSLNSV